MVPSRLTTPPSAVIFTLFGSRFVNPNNFAFSAVSDNIGGYVMLSWTDPENHLPAQFDGLAQFSDNEIAGGLVADHAIFKGAAQNLHGLTLIDDSINASRRALRERPDDPAAGQFLLAAYAKKLDLMQDIAMK